MHIDEFDALDADAIVAKPVALVATAGSDKHALVVDAAFRPLLAYFRAFVVPTSVFAGPGDWSNPSLGEHVARAAGELATLMRLGVEREVRSHSWDRYEHALPGAARTVESGSDASGFTLDDELRRLATGGSLPPRPGKGATPNRPR